MQLQNYHLKRVYAPNPLQVVVHKLLPRSAIRPEKVIVRYKLSKMDYLRHIRLAPPTQEANKLHPHPMSAELRRRALQAVRYMCKQLNKQMHVISPGPNESLLADASTRYHYWARDLMVAESNHPLTHDSLLYLQDVDYYTDMNYILGAGLPVVLYTIIPRKAASRKQEYAYRFENGQFLFTSNGGTAFSHLLWDYDLDTCAIERSPQTWLSWFLGPRERMVTFFEKTEVYLGMDRYLVFFIPRYRVSGWTYDKMNLGISRLVRRSVTSNGVTIWPDRATPGLLSLALQGEFNYQTISIKREMLETVRLKMNLIGDTFKSSTHAEISRYLVNNKVVPVEESALAATILCRLFGKIDIQLGPDWYSTGLDDIIRTGGQRLHPPLLNHPALLPNRSAKVEQITIDERIVGPQNVKNPHQYRRFAEEFVEMSIPEPNVGVPYDLTEVMERQHKPMQKLRHRTRGPWVVIPQYEMVTPDGKVPITIDIQAFQKVEPYANPKPARNISTTPSNHQYILSTFTLSMKETLKQHAWFIPSMTPSEVQASIERLRLKPHLICRDFSSFDATVSRWLYAKVVRPMAQRWVHPDFYQDFIGSIDAEQDAIGYTQHGLQYPIASTRVTGSPTTSDHNTIINAFASYCVLRKLGQNRKTAFANLGMYYGDDSIDYFPVDKIAIHDEVMKELGLKAKTEVVYPDRPTPFLGRYFVEGGSFCDPDRNLAKLHLSASSLPRDVAAMNKAMGYWSSDSKTPIIGEWAKCLIRLAASHGVKFDATRMQSDEYWRYNQNWPQTVDLVKHFTQVSQFTLENIRDFENTFRHATDFDWDILIENLPWTYRADAVVNGDMHNDITDVTLKTNARSRLKIPKGRLGNLCFLDAIVQSASLPYEDGDDLYRRLWIRNVNIPNPGDKFELDHIDAVAKHLDLDLYLSYSDETLHWPGSTFCCVKLDFQSEHYTPHTGVGKYIADYPSSVVGSPIFDTHANKPTTSTIDATRTISAASGTTTDSTTTTTSTTEVPDSQRTLQIVSTPTGSSVSSEKSSNSRKRRRHRKPRNVPSSDTGDSVFEEWVRSRRNNMDTNSDGTLRQIPIDTSRVGMATGAPRNADGWSDLHVLRPNNDNGDQQYPSGERKSLRKPETSLPPSHPVSERARPTKSAKTVGLVSGQYTRCHGDSGGSGNAAHPGHPSHSCYGEGGCRNPFCTVRDRIDEPNSPIAPRRESGTTSVRANRIHAVRRVATTKGNKHTDGQATPKSHGVNIRGKRSQGQKYQQSKSSQHVTRAQPKTLPLRFSMEPGSASFTTIPGRAGGILTIVDRQTVSKATGAHRWTRTGSSPRPQQTNRPANRNIRAVQASGGKPPPVRDKTTLPKRVTNKR
uniref:RNA-directed RNA polymerase n=1 Tax=Tetnovirus 2 TaxID=870712 RepID=E0A3R1_9VIRU|nr:unknown [Tetnovirus 2]